MNYYNHHIGDFRGGTIHMTKVMRWLYRDMLEAYYDAEKPLPAEMDDLCDLIGAYEESEREAVKRVLKLKFDLLEDGYHHSRCDAAIEAYKASVAEELARSENEAERQRRYRARRKVIFARLREEFDEVPAYDISMSDLSALLKSHEQRRDMAGTFDGTTEDIHSTSQPVTRDTQVCPPVITAITNNQEPITNNHKPEKINTLSEQSPDAASDPVDNLVENDEKEPPAKPGKRLHSTEEDREAAEWIFKELVQKVNPGAKPPNIESWANDIRMMREIDDRTHRQICELFKWAAHDSFWCPNILSPAKLREKWDQLVLKRAGVRPASQLNQGGAYAATMENAQRAKAMIFGEENATK